MKWKHDDYGSKSNVIAVQYGVATFVSHRVHPAFIGKWSASIYNRKTYDCKRLGFFGCRKDAMYAIEQYLEYNVVVPSLDIVINAVPSNEVAPFKADPREYTADHFAAIKELKSGKKKK